MVVGFKQSRASAKGGGRGEFRQHKHSARAIEAVYDFCLALLALPHHQERVACLGNEADALGLKNVTAVHRNVIEEKGKFDFVVSRAVMNLNDLFKLVRKNVRPGGTNALPNGLICLKGGDLVEELSPLRKTAVAWPLSGYFQEEFFETKSAVYVPCR